MTRIATLAAAHDLRAVLQGKVVLLGDAGWRLPKFAWARGARPKCAKLWRQHRKIAGYEAALGSRLHLLANTAARIKLSHGIGPRDVE
jgi:hypothetical protein